MKIYWIAGEPSGDVQAAAVAEALQTRQASIEQRGWGGPQLAAAGIALDRDICSEPFMGFVEVVLRARTIARRFTQCKRDVLAFQPDVLVLVDYPGFNLRMAAWAKSQGIRVAYFIPPKTPLLTACIPRLTGSKGSLALRLAAPSPTVEQPARMAKRPAPSTALATRFCDVKVFTAATYQNPMSRIMRILD